MTEERNCQQAKTYRHTQTTATQHNYNVTMKSNTSNIFTYRMHVNALLVWHIQVPHTTPNTKSSLLKDRLSLAGSNSRRIQPFT